MPHRDPRPLGYAVSQPQARYTHHQNPHPSGRTGPQHYARYMPCLDPYLLGCMGSMHYQDPCPLAEPDPSPMWNNPIHTLLGFPPLGLLARPLCWIHTLPESPPLELPSPQAL